MTIRILFALMMLTLCTQIVAAQQKIIFHDRFKRNKNKWPIISDEDFSVTIKDRAIIFEKKEKNSVKNGCLWYSKPISKFKTDKDFHISFDSQILYWDDIFNAFDFQWGLIDETDTLNTKRVIYQLDFANDAVRLSKFEQGKGWQYYNWSSSYSKSFNSTFLLQPQTTNKIDVIQKENFLLVSINDVNVYQIAIEPLKGNSIGIQQCLKSKWVMRNLKIRQ